MDNPRDYQEDKETDQFLKELQEQREQQEADMRADAHALDVQRVKDMMMKNPGEMQRELQEKMEKLEEEEEKKS